VFNSVVVDGQAGLLSVDGSSSFDEYTVMTNASQFAVAVTTHQEASSSAGIVPIEYVAPNDSELGGMMNASSQFWGISGIVTTGQEANLSTVSEPEEGESVVFDAYGASYVLNSEADSHIQDAYHLDFDPWIQLSYGVSDLAFSGDDTNYSHQSVYVTEFDYFTTQSSLLTLVNSSLLEATRYILPDYSSNEFGYLFLRG
jgi:hypothetical protein